MSAVNLRLQRSLTSELEHDAADAVHPSVRRSAAGSGFSERQSAVLSDVPSTRAEAVATGRIDSAKAIIDRQLIPGPYGAISNAK